MKKLLFTLTLACALALGSQSASAQAKKKKSSSSDTTPATAPAATPAPTATKPLPLHTIVSSVDAKSQSFTHKNKDGKEVKFVVTSKTELMNEGKSASFSDIKVGDEVNGLRLKMSDTEYEVVKTTYIGAPKPKAEKPAKKKP